MQDETRRDRLAILPSVPILVALLIADYALFRLIPGIDTGSQRSLRYAPLFALAAAFFLLGLVLSWRSSQWRSLSPSTELAPSGTLRHMDRLYAGALVLAMVGSIFFAYLVGKVLVFRLDHETVWKDTLTYAVGAEVPIWSSQFWAGERSFTLPLIYKLLGVDRASLSHPSILRRISSFQFILGVLSWATLASVSGSLIKTRWLKLMGFGVILGMGMSLDVSLWDRVPLSESVSASLLVLLVSLAFVGLKLRDRLGRHGAKWQVPYWFGFGVVCVLYSFTRDTNAYFLAACGLVSLSAFGVFRIWRQAYASVWIGFSVFLLALFSVQSWTADRGNRWVLPFFNILHMRVLSDEDARSLFQSAGMPADEVTNRILDRNRRRFMDELQHNFAAQPLIDWVEAHGRTTYLRFLLSRPIASFMEPINRAQNLISPLSTEYRTDVYSVPVWLEYFSRVFFPLPLGIMFGWVAVVLLATYVFGRLNGLRAEWIVPGILLLTALPMMYVVWYGDAIEVERHAFQISVQVRLALWMMTVFLADDWLGQLSSPSGTGASRGVGFSHRRNPGG